jgi:hypothetical protein
MMLKRNVVIKKEEAKKETKEDPKSDFKEEEILFNEKFKSPLMMFGFYWFFAAVSVMCSLVFGAYVLIRILRG